MINHHLPAMPHGQPPIPPHPRRQDEMHYPPGPANMRSPPAYMNYHPPVNGHIPPVYAHHYPPPWYNGYPQMHPPPPGGPIPPGPPLHRPYQQPPYHHGPLIVSSYPHSQPVPAPMHLPANVFHQPPSTASTPVQTVMSPHPPPTGDHQISFDVQERPPSSVQSVLSTSSGPIASPSATVELSKGALLARLSFRAPLPWLSVPEVPFPERAPHKRRNARSLQKSKKSVELPAKDSQKQESLPANEKQSHTHGESVSELQTPNTSQAPSESDSTHPTTPLSATHSAVTSQSLDHAQAQTPKQSVVIPVVPVLPQTPATPKQPASVQPSQESGASQTNDEVNSTASSVPKPSPPAAPKSWADLVRSKMNRVPSSASNVPADPNNLQTTRTESLADVLTNLGSDVDQFGDKIAFLEPRGLVNTGNMCYMNSILQVLAYCVPFYQFLDYIGRRATHSFKSDIPLIDATIMFMREFRVIDAAQSEEQLRMRLKHKELEEYGEAFIPEFVYEVIRQLPRFRDMRRGHQQDAQEFLGFLLEELHEECAHALQSGVSKPSNASAETTAEAEGWLEVGHKQKSAITRSSGDVNFESPITKIFGGKIRSEFKVPGNKNSVTLEPYQPLQLDIGSPEVNNIVDALKGLTKPETIHGDFSSPRGIKVAATKQVFIETLPPVLILHLKRFQYDSVTHGTQKIWKKVGYPLELEIPREVFPPHRRNAMAIHGGLPHYRLIGVIYHHGKNASGGHYTVDVRRQDGREWIRMDDTVIRRVRSEDVAEAGSEEDPKVLAAALEQHKRDANSNMYESIDQSNQIDDTNGWSQVNGTGPNGHTNKKPLAGAVNGSSSPAPSSNSPGNRTPLGRYGTRDNKVAYLLFYQRISSP